MLVPLAAFDARGHRIGYGAGHYDRAIARLRAFRKPVEAIAMPPDWGKDVNDALNFKGDPS